MKVYGMILLGCSPVLSSLVILCCLYICGIHQKMKKTTKRLSTYPDLKIGQPSDQTNHGGILIVANTAVTTTDDGCTGGDCGGDCGCDD